MSKSKAKGTRFESALVSWLQANGFPDARRETLHGTKDVGDVWGVKWMGLPVVVEAKDCQQQRHIQWLEEAETERRNARAVMAIVVAHKKGCGLERFGDNDCLIDLKYLAHLMGANNFPTGYAILRLKTVAAMLRGDYE